MQKMLATIDEACEATGLGRTFLYERIRDRKIETVHAGKRRLVVVESLQAYVASLRAAA